MAKYPSEAECKRVNARLDTILDTVERYAERKRYTDESTAMLETAEELLSTLPEGWDATVQSMLDLTTVTGNRKRCAAFVRSLRDELSERDLAIVRLWRNLPWLYVAFTDMTSIDHDLLEVTPIGNPPPSWPPDRPWDRITIYSPGLVNAARSRPSSGFALLWAGIAGDGGVVFFTYGMLLAFSTFDSRDFEFFTAVLNDTMSDSLPLVSGVNEMGVDVSATMMAHPVPYLRLFSYQNIPEVSGRGGAWVYCASAARYDGPEDLSDEGLWQRLMDETGEKVQETVFLEDFAGVRLGNETPMYEPNLFIDFEERAVLLRAMTESAYRRGVAAVANLVSMPDEPQARASMAMMAAADTIVGRYDLLGEIDEDVSLELDEVPGDLTGDGLGPEGDHEDGAGGLESVQAVINLLMENFNEGTEHSDKDIALRTGVTVAEVASIRTGVEQSLGERRSAGTGGPPETTTAADRFGLPPGPFHRLLTRPIPEEQRYLALRDLPAAGLDEATLREIASTPLMRFTRWMLTNTPIPATKAGYVAPKVLRTLVVDGLKQSEAEVPSREGESPRLKMYRTILEQAHLIRLDGGAFVSHPRNAAVSPDDIALLYEILLTTMFVKGTWAQSQWLPEIPHLAESAGFLLYAVQVLSLRAGSGVEPRGWVDIPELVDVFLGAHPELARAVEQADRKARSSDSFYASPRWLVETALESNFCEKFGGTLGILDLDSGEARRGAGDRSARVRPSPLFPVVFTTG